MCSIFPAKVVKSLENRRNNNLFFECEEGKLLLSPFGSKKNAIFALRFDQAYNNVSLIYVMHGTKLVTSSIILLGRPNKDINHVTI